MSAEKITYLGNPSPHEAKTEAGQLVGTARLDGPAVTEVHWQPDVLAALKANAKEVADASNDRAGLLEHLLSDQSLTDWEIALKHVIAVARAHAGAGFNWIASEDSQLAKLLGEFFDAEIAPHGTAAALTLAKAEDAESWQERIAELHGPTALITKAGKDVIFAASFGTAAQPAAANYVALTANNEAESASNTSLAGEIATAEGGLIRKQGTYAHTTGAATATLTTTFTGNSHDSYPVTVNKFAVFNKATSGGSMAIETKITAATFAQEGDNVALTETISLS